MMCIWTYIGSPSHILTSARASAGYAYANKTNAQNVVILVYQSNASENVRTDFDISDDFDQNFTEPCGQHIDGFLHG